MVRNESLCTGIAHHKDGEQMSILEEIVHREPFGPLEKRDVIWTVSTDMMHPVGLVAIYTPNGAYVGDEEMAAQLLERGILPELARLEHHTCSVGFCAREQKWYGWSHRAIHGFAIGDIVEDGDCVATPRYDSESLEYLALHPEEDRSLPIGFVAQTLDDARRMAVAFAESVS